MVTARPSLVVMALVASAISGCATELPADGAARGAVLFKNCVQCHGADGEGSTLMDAPAIAGLPQWYIEAQVTHFQTGWRGAHSDDVEGLKMRPMSRTLKSAADVALVAQHVSGLSVARGELTVAGDASKGQAAYATCAACHGADGSGNEAMKAPPLRQLNDWYIVSQLRKFKTGVRAYEPADATGATMKAMAGAVPDEAAMRDLAAYIHTLPL
jgi:cytochrome c553